MPKKQFLLFVAMVLLGTGASSFVYSQNGPTRPKLVLVLSIDQMRFDYLTRFDELYKGGLRRLLDQGAVFTNAKYRHANTETGPGHSVILSGRHASHSGIVANTWYDPFLKKSINVVDDPVQLPVGGKGRSASPTNFIGFTVGDVLKQLDARDPTSTVFRYPLDSSGQVSMAKNEQIDIENFGEVVNRVLALLNGCDCELNQCLEYKYDMEREFM